MSYNGWSNYETWAVKLWIDNEEGSYRYWGEQTEQAMKDNDYDTSDAALDLAKQLKAEHKEAIPELQGVFADLLNAALSEVDWGEIGNSMAEDYASEHADEIKAAKAETEE